MDTLMPRSELIEELMEGFMVLDKTERFIFVRKILVEAAKDRWLYRKILDIVARTADSGGTIGRWIEARLTTNMELTPRQVARQAASAHRLEKKAVPYLIVLARRIKNKLQKQAARSGLHDGLSPTARQEDGPKRSLGHGQKRGIYAESSISQPHNDETPALVEAASENPNDEKSLYSLQTGSLEAFW